MPLIDRFLHNLLTYLAQSDQNENDTNPLWIIEIGAVNLFYQKIKINFFFSLVILMLLCNKKCIAI